MKSEIRNPKPEGNPKSETPISDLVLRASFGLRISDFGFPDGPMFLRREIGLRDHTRNAEPSSEIRLPCLWPGCLGIRGWPRSAGTRPNRNSTWSRSEHTGHIRCVRPGGGTGFIASVACAHKHSRRAGLRPGAITDTTRRAADRRFGNQPTDLSTERNPCAAAVPETPERIRPGKVPHLFETHLSEMHGAVRLRVFAAVQGQG